MLVVFWVGGVIRGWGQCGIKRSDLILIERVKQSFDKKRSEQLLFTHFSLRAGKSTIIITNLFFERWDEIFPDPVFTAAMGELSYSQNVCR